MRQIKLRAWQTTHETMIPFQEDGDYFFIDQGNGLELHNKYGQCKNVIFLQFTGLKDKNGVDIYEGDIVQNDNGQNYVVEWIEQIGGFYFTIPNTHRGKEVISCAASKQANEPMLLYKEAVIGNIYEYPELLNSDKDDERSVATETK